MSKHLTSQNLYGFRITKEGKLVFWCYLLGTRLSLPDTTCEVPDCILERGVKAVEEYIDDQVDVVVKAAEEKDRQWKEKYDVIHVEISVEFNGQTLRGLITSTKGSGLTVRLEEPDDFKTENILNPNRYSRPTPPGEELLTEAVKPSMYAINRAKEILVSMYERQVHERAYPLVYEVARALEKRKSMRK